MTAVLPYFNDIDREIIWLLKLYLPRCTRENGISPCTAIEDCMFTYPTCKDKDNYEQGERVWQFCSRMAHLEDCFSMLRTKGLRLLPTAIDSEKFRTERGEMRIGLADGDPPYLADATKTTSPVLAETAESFWPWFFATQVWQGGTAEISYGFFGMDIADFELFFRGRIRDLDYTKQGVEVRIYDRLWKLGDIKVPADSSTDVVLTATYNGGSTMYVSDASLLRDATVNDPRQVQVEDEIIEYTGRDTGLNELTGCSPGAYATSQVSHAVDTEVIQVQVYGSIDNYGVMGVGADEIYMDLLVGLGGVPADSIGVVDVGAILNGAIGPGDTSIAVSCGTGGWVGRGIGYLDDEIISWESYNIVTSTLEGVKRGRFGTQAVSHSDATSILPPTFTCELNQYLPGTEYQAKLTEPTAIKEHIEGLQRCTIMDVYQDEDGYVKGQVQAPPWFDEIPPLITKAHMKPQSRKVLNNDTKRVTRVYGYYAPLAGSPGSKAEDYRYAYVYAGAEEENPKWYGETQSKTMYLPFIFRSLEARLVTGKYFARYRQGIPQVECVMELVNMPLRIANQINMDVPEIVDEFGVCKRRLYRLVRKEFKPPNALVNKFEDTGFGTKRYPTIGYKNGVLNATLPAGQNYLDLDVSASGTPPLVAWAASGGIRVVGTHKHGEYGTGTFEDILYSGGVTDLGGGVLRFSNLLRGQNGTIDSTWSAGLDVTMQYSSGDTDIVHPRYGFQGDANNQVASVAYTPDEDGYYIF
jgi:hypothetical protein